MRSSRNYSTILVLLSTILFGSYGVWSRLIGSDMGNFFQGWTRALIILVLIVPILIWRWEIAKIQKRDYKWLAIFLVFTSLTQAPLFYAFNHMDIGTASLLFFVSMFITMNIIGFCLLKEHITKVQILASILALIGMYFVFSFSISQFTLLAALMAVLNGIASGGEVAFSKKLTGNYSPLFVMSLSWIIILVSNIIISLIIGENQSTTTTAWFWQLCYSVASLLSFWMVIAGFKYIDASVGALLGLLEIVFSIAFGMLIFGEHIRGIVILGATLIIIAVVLPLLMDRISRNRIQTKE